MRTTKHTPKQAQMQAVIDKLVAACGALQDIQVDMSKVLPFACYSSTFLQRAINSTDESINAMIEQLGEKNLK